MAAFQGGVPSRGSRHSSIAKNAASGMKVKPSKSTALRRCRAMRLNARSRRGSRGGGSVAAAMGVAGFTDVTGL